SGLGADFHLRPRLAGDRAERRLDRVAHLDDFARRGFQGREPVLSDPADRGHRQLFLVRRDLVRAGPRRHGGHRVRPLSAEPDAAFMSVSDAVKALIESRRHKPEPGKDFFVFAYGSLMWRPDFPFVEIVPATLYGYHRAFCITSTHYRGT